MSQSLPPRVEQWRRRGEELRFRDRRIHLFRREGSDPVLLLLHGFPTSSYDWRLLLSEEGEASVLAPDFLGFGLSEKPRDHDYSLVWQADLAEEVVRRFAAGRPVVIVAHDMGTSVATELLARDIDGELEMDLLGALLFNGSVVQGAASPTLAQRLLRSPLGPVAARLSSERFFRQQFGSIFSPHHALREEEAEDQWALIRAEGGHRIGHRLVRYMNERERRADRWHGALRDWPKPIRLAWGMLDPVATPAVLAAVRDLRPAATVTEWADLGHYPQLEDPARAVAEVRAAVAKFG